MEIRDRVIVITGASSGLGRALAFELAGRGARLALAARREEALEDVAARCQQLGGAAIVVPTDVTIEAEVAQLAQTVVDRWGRLDVWINNAGVTLYAPLITGDIEQHRRVIETNLWGYVFGARAAVPIFRRQHAGILINVGSVLSEVGQPFVPSYVISKFAVHGLSETLRVELANEPAIHVCTAMPYAVDTPHFQVAANAIGKTPRAMPPVQAPEKVARAIAKLVERPRRTMFVPRAIVLGLALHRLFPRTVERLLLDSLRRWHVSDEPEQTGDGNLYEPEGDAKVHGDRPPQLSTPQFFGWVAARLVRNEVEAIGRLAKRATGRAAQGRGA